LFKRSPALPKLAIIADDLTGALDAAAPFAARGLRTRVAVVPEMVSAVLDAQADVISVNTGSREIAAWEARQRVERVLSALPAGVRLFKKVDSRLKGNVEAELGAFATGRLAMLPAIPEFGRVVEGGQIRGFGIDQPIDIAGILGGLAARADVPDIRTAPEMHAALRAVPDGALLVGARGLADVLADMLTQRPPRPVSRLGSALTMAIGSRDPITLGQIEALRHRRLDMRILEAPNGVLASEGPAESAGLTLLQATPGDAQASAVDVAKALATSLRGGVLDGQDGLLISGGATAEIVLDALGIDRLDVAGEIVAGLPVSKARDLAIITKSGGFGSRDALIDVADAYFAT
jgi:uncharacterized protein YgbK (DUF1537 family)